TVDTSEDYTMASARVLTKDQDLGFDLLADILRRPAFPEAELERVRNLVLGQILSEQENPDRVASKAFHQLVFPNHPYRWPVNGTETTLPGITRADVQGFHGREYLPNQTILAIVGDLTVEQARAQVRKFFGDWPRGDAPPRKTPAPNGLDRTVTQFIDRGLTQATIMLGHVGVRRGDPDYYAVSVMNYILGSGGFASRLMDTIRDKQGLAYGVFSSFEANLMPGAFVVSLQTRNETANQALRAVLAELEGMQQRPITDRELADAKAYLMGSFPLRLDTTQKLAEILTLVEFFDLGLEYFTNYPKWIEKVTKEDVLLAARTYLHPDRYALVVVGNLATAQIEPPPTKP
ncbi:MAG: M16 family metallopeptidase, partial [Nitrospirales bacterium]